MRVLLALSATVAVSACGQFGNEPLRRSGFEGTERNSRVEQVGNETVVGVGQEEEVGGEVEAPATNVRDELAATVQIAADHAFVAADAGLQHDRASAESIAVALAQVAADVATAASEIEPTEECGCGGCTTVSDPAVDDAVLFSALASEAANGIVEELNPPSTTVCTDGGCHSVCEEVPGEVDEVGLQSAVDSALDAGEGCASAGDALAPL